MIFVSVFVMVFGCVFQRWESGYVWIDVVSVKWMGIDIGVIWSFGIVKDVGSGISVNVVVMVFGCVLKSM